MRTALVNSQIKTHVSALGRAVWATAADAIPDFAALAAEGKTPAHALVAASIKAAVKFGFRVAKEEDALGHIQEPSVDDSVRLVMVAAMRVSLEEAEPQFPAHAAWFESWQTLLTAALDPKQGLLQTVLPFETWSLVDSATQHAAVGTPAEDVLELLQFWNAWQVAKGDTGSYPAIPPDGPAIPEDLRSGLPGVLLPGFDRACITLLRHCA